MQENAKINDFQENLNFKHLFFKYIGIIIHLRDTKNFNSSENGAVLNFKEVLI